jgi:hypothetical protein
MSEVYPDDSIAISFYLNTGTGEWSNEWVTSPGSAGSAAGEVYSISDSVVPDSVVCKCSPSCLVKNDIDLLYSGFRCLNASKYETSLESSLLMCLGIFVIELQAGATWNFGPLIFKDIKIVAETSETGWCTT